MGGFGETVTTIERAQCDQTINKIFTTINIGKQTKIIVTKVIRFNLW
jgi:hypothetical protein